MPSYISLGAEDTRRLLLSLAMIVVILLGAWATGPIASIVLVSAQVGDDVYQQILGLVAGISVWLGTCAMCPALYVIKYVLDKTWHSMANKFI
jgi:hypothetical protein